MSVFLCALKNYENVCADKIPVKSWVVYIIQVTNSRGKIIELSWSLSFISYYFLASRLSRKTWTRRKLFPILLILLQSFSPFSFHPCNLQLFLLQKSAAWLKHYTWVSVILYGYQGKTMERALDRENRETCMTFSVFSNKQPLSLFAFLINKYLLTLIKITVIG